MANNNNIILDNLNGEYVKFYATNNGALKTLLNNSGNIIIYQDTTQNGENRIYTYLGDVLLSSGVGFTDEYSYKAFMDAAHNAYTLLDEHSTYISYLQEVVKLNQQAVENLSESHINIPGTNEQIKLSYLLFNKIIPEYKTPEVIKESSYIEYITNEYSQDSRFSPKYIAYSHDSSFIVPKNCYISLINRNAVVKNNDEIITYYSSRIQKNKDNVGYCISKLNGSKNSSVDSFNIIDYSYYDNESYISSYDYNNINSSNIDIKTVSYLSYLYTSGTIKIKNEIFFKNIYTSDNITYINKYVMQNAIPSYEHFKLPTKLMLSDLYIHNYPYITTYTYNNDNKVYSYIYNIINALNERICITNAYTNNIKKAKNECFIHKDFFVEKVEMYDNDSQKFQNISGLCIIDNNYNNPNFNKYIINTGRYYNSNIYLTLNKNIPGLEGNNYSGLSWNTIQNNDYNHSHWITYNETITSSNISYLVNLTPITYNFTDKIDPNKIINYNSEISLQEKNRLYIPKFYKDKSVLTISQNNKVEFGYNLPDETITYYKDIEYSYFDVTNYLGIKFNYDIIYLGNNILTNPEHNVNFSNITQILKNTVHFIDSNIHHNLVYSSSNYNDVSYLTLPNNYTVTGYLSITDNDYEIKHPLDIYVTGENEKLFTYTTNRYYNYRINKDNYNNLDTAGKTVKINLYITNDIA